MKTKTNPFVKAVDEIRRHKKMTIQQLTENIISTRTYHRYLNGKTDVTISTLNQLVERLNVDVVDILYYMMYVKTNEINFNEFINMIIKKEPGQTEALYHDISQTHDQLMWEQYLILDAYYLKQQFEQGKVEQDTYEKFLVKHIERVVSEPGLNIYHLAFMSLFLQSGLDHQAVTIDLLINRLLEDFYAKQRLIMYFMVVDDVMTYALKQKYRNVDLLSEMVDKLYKHAQSYHTMLMMTNCQLYYAYIHHLLGHQTLTNHHLFRYLNGRKLIRKKDEMGHEDQLVNEIFGIDSEDFLTTNELL